VRTFCIVPKRSFFAKGNSCPFSLTSFKTQLVHLYDLDDRVFETGIRFETLRVPSRMLLLA